MKENIGGTNVCIHGKCNIRGSEEILVSKNGEIVNKFQCNVCGYFFMEEELIIENHPFIDENMKKIILNSVDFEDIDN